MSKVDATAFKAAIAAAAAQLQIAWRDDVLAELAVDFKNPHTPMRMLDKLFVLDVTAATVKANDDYIDAFYNGKWTYKGDGMNDIGPPTPIALVSATLETAEPTSIVLTFDKPMVNRQEMVASIAGAAAAGKKITDVVVSGSVVTIKVDIAFIAADVVTVSGRFFGARGYIDLNAQAVTNNIV